MDRDAEHSMNAAPAGWAGCLAMLLGSTQRGIVEIITAEGGGESMNELSLLYTGKPKRYGIEAPPQHELERILYKIKPTRVNTSG